MNRTTLNKLRSLLFTARLNKKLWVECLLAVVYLYNRIPHSAIEFKTSFELRNSTKPLINHIKLYGSLAYSKDYKAKKLEPRAKPTILIGYGSN